MDALKHDKEAIIGETLDSQPVYNYDLLSELIAQREGWDIYEAAAWIDHNFTGCLGAPVIVKIKEET